MSVLVRSMPIVFNPVDIFGSKVLYGCRECGLTGSSGIGGVGIICDMEMCRYCTNISFSRGPTLLWIVIDTDIAVSLTLGVCIIA